MDFIRKLSIWLASLICVIAISGTVSLLTLQTTILDRSVVKSWLQQSKLYDDNKLVSAIVQTPSGEQAQDIVTIPPEAIKTALGNTYNSEFIQTQTETVVNAAYDWMEGKTSDFQFSIPIDQKRDTLIQQLSTAIEPQVATIPVCSLRVQTGCRTPGLTPLQYAQQLATQSIQESGAFSEPLTNKSIAQPVSDPKETTSSFALTQLPLLRSIVSILIVALPLVALLSVIFISLMTQGSSRLAILSKLSRRVFFGVALSLAGSIFILWIGHDSDFGLTKTLTAQASDIGGLVAPLVKIIIIGLASKLALFSSIVCLVSLAAWICFRLLQKRAVQAAKIQAASTDTLLPETAVPPFNNQY